MKIYKTRLDRHEYELTSLDYDKNEVVITDIFSKTTLKMAIKTFHNNFYCEEINSSVIEHADFMFDY